ncbi:MAG TPA: amidohydrolase family protein, partial [Chloroflexota bacterium]
MTDHSSSLRLSDVLVVDVDVHVNDVPEELAPYADQPWRRALEHLATVPRRYLDIPGYAPALRVHPSFPGGVAIRHVNTAEQMLEELASIDVDMGVIFPDHLLLLALIYDRDYAFALAQAYNRWLLDKWLHRDPALVGALCVAPQHPEASAREIERYAGEGGVVAVYLPCAGVDPLWGDRIYDPIYEAAQSANLPVMLHAVNAVAPVYPFQLHRMPSVFAQHAVSHNFSMMANMVHMIATGVPERFPRLKVCFTEAGVSWVPHMKMRLDKEYLERRREVPILKKRPSHYIRRWYVATQPVEEPENPQPLVHLIDMIGDDVILFASDWPH